MNLTIAAAVFPVIFLGELPDKTMIASLALSTRGRAGAVWTGAAAAFAVHVAIATTAGVLAFRYLPQRVIEGAVAAVFLAGAILVGREALRERRDAGDGRTRRRADSPGRPAAESGPGPAAPPKPGWPEPVLPGVGGAGVAGAGLAAAGAALRPRWSAASRPSYPAPARTAAASFAVIFAAEWGDLTQMLTANLAAHYHSPISVAAGAALALWSAAALAVLGGRRLASLVNPFAIRVGTAILLAGLALYTAWTALA